MKICPPYGWFHKGYRDYATLSASEKCPGDVIPLIVSSLPFADLFSLIINGLGCWRSGDAAAAACLIIVVYIILLGGFLIISTTSTTTSPDR